MTNVKVNSVAKTYGTTPVLSDITTEFPEGSFTSLLGPSGSGKTTLLRIIAGFIKPDQGIVRIGNNDVTDIPVWGRNIGMMFQSYALFPHMTIAQNVAFGLERRGIKGAAARKEVDRALEMVRLPGFGDRTPKQLSGVSSSASHWPAPSSSSRAYFFSTSRCRRSIAAFARRCRSNCCASSVKAA